MKTSSLKITKYIESLVIGELKTEKRNIIYELICEFRLKINCDKVTEICSLRNLWLLVASAKILVLDW